MFGSLLINVFHYSFMSRWLSLVFLVLLSTLQVKLWVSGGMRDVWRLEKAVAEQKQINAAQLEKNQRLAAEVADLKGGAEAVEERARSELGMVKTGETFYQVIDAKPNLLPDLVPGDTAARVSLYTP
jgi:cell division protein FtsB